MSDAKYKGTLADKIHPGRVIKWFAIPHFLCLLITMGIVASEVDDFAAYGTKLRDTISEECQAGAAVALTVVSMVFTLISVVYTMMNKHALPIRWYAIVIFTLYWGLSICAFSVVLKSQDKCYLDVQYETTVAIAQEIFGRKMLQSYNDVIDTAKAATAFASIGVIETFAQLCLFVWFAVVWFSRKVTLTTA